MGPLQALYETTEKLVELLEKPGVQTERDQTITEIQGLLQERDTLLPQVQPPYTGEEQSLGQRVLALNERAEMRMKELQETIKMDVKSLRKRKTSQQRYVNPYANTSAQDGMFYDKKR